MTWTIVGLLLLLILLCKGVAWLFDWSSFRISKKVQTHEPSRTQADDLRLLSEYSPKAFTSPAKKGFRSDFTRHLQ